MCQRLPGSARAVTSSKFAGELIEIVARTVFPLCDYMVQAGPIQGRFRHVGHSQPDETCQFSLLNWTRRIPAIINILPHASVLNKSGTLQLRQVSRDA